MTITTVEDFKIPNTNSERKFIDQYKNSMKSVTTRVMTIDNINKNNRNYKLIKPIILSDEDMRKIGFKQNYYEGTDYEKYSPYWWFTKRIEFPKEKRWKNIEIDFTVEIPKDGSDIDIKIIDMEFCQPYDYQYLLFENSKNECANIVKEQVELWMTYLQENGVINGYNCGDYI